MNTETESLKFISLQVKALVRRRVAVMAGVLGLANVAAGLVCWRSLTAEAGAYAREEVAKISASYVRRESAALNGVTEVASTKANSLKQENAALQHSLTQTESELARLKGVLVEQVLMSERITKAMEDREKEREWIGNPRVAKAQ